LAGRKLLIDANGTVSLDAAKKVLVASPKPIQVRAVLLAAAEDADALSPCGRNALALSLLDQGLVTCNGCDRVLKWYPRLDGHGGPEAIGAIGPCCVSDAGRLCLIDVSCEVGKHHDYSYYLSAPSVCSRLAFFTFLDDAPADK
jgi:hypothetical protein